MGGLHQVRLDALGVRAGRRSGGAGFYRCYLIFRAFDIGRRFQALSGARVRGALLGTKHKTGCFSIRCSIGARRVALGVRWTLGVLLKPGAH